VTGAISSKISEVVLGVLYFSMAEVSAFFAMDPAGVEAGAAAVGVEIFFADWATAVPASPSPFKSPR